MFVPNDKIFLKDSMGKASLASYMSEYLGVHIQVVVVASCLPAAVTLLKFKQIIPTSVLDLKHVFSTHGEADTRMLLHAIYSVDNHTSIIVRHRCIGAAVVLL